MPQTSKLRYDTASAVSIGKRDHQEDALITDFPLGADLGFAVLADGMGGHAAGDVASKIAVTAVFSELKLQSGDAQEFGTRTAEILKSAAEAANDRIARHSTDNDATAGMGSTMLALACVGDRLHWLSVGDSPLYLYRNGALARLNADHSMAPQIDLMASLGQISAEEARYHPERSCLTSVLCGAPIARIDCPETALELTGGEIVVAASDGLQFLDKAEIGHIVRRHRSHSAARIAAALLEAVEALNDPDQDNTTLAVIKALPASGRRRPAWRPALHRSVNGAATMRATRNGHPSPLAWLLPRAPRARRTP